jgi:glycosyltransferase involved in cell wall biosynthesis
MIKRKRPPRDDVAFYAPRMGPLLAPEARSSSGGAETQILLLARALASRGARVRLVVFDLPGIPIPASVDGVAISVRPPYQAHEPLGKLREAGSIGRAIRKSNADVLVSRVSTPEVGLAGLFAKLSRRRFVYSSANVSDFVDDRAPGRRPSEGTPPSGRTNESSEFDFSRLARKRRDWQLFRLGIRLADEIVVQTEEQVRLCEDRFGRSPVMIRSIAELAPQRDSDPEAFLWIGRLVSYKRPLAFVELARSLPNARFWMVAVPPLHARDLDLEASVARAAADVHNLETFVPRPRSELMELIDRAVAVVNTADFEGMPNIFLEGWARGVPALALAHDPDGVIERHELGAFAHRSSERLVELASRLWEERRDQVDIAERCRRYILDFHSPEVIGERWQDVLRIPARLAASQTDAGVAT